MNRLKVGVLASGRGSNLQSILEASAAGRLDAEVALVVSDVEDAQALQRANRAGVEAIHVPPGRFRSRLDPDAEERVVEALQERGVEIVALAGFMRILHDRFLGAFPRKIVNVHPALLPSFPGLEAQRQAYEYGVKWTGATVHFVDGGVDTGPIILQAAVPVLEDDTAETLAARILEEEHRIYPEALQLLAEDRVLVEGRRVRILPPGSTAGAR